MIASLSDLLHSIRLLRADCALLEIGAGSAARLQTHRAVQLHLALSGHPVFRFPARDHVVALEPGQYLFAPPGTDHIIGERADDRPMAIGYFEDAHAADTPPRLKIGQGPPHMRVLSGALYIDQARHETLVRLLPELRSYRARNGPTLYSAHPLLSVGGLASSMDGAGSSAILLKLAELLLVDATRVSLTRDLSPAFDAGVPDMPQIGAALRIIYQDPARRWSIAMLAREVGMSRSAFAAAFSRLVKETPMRFLTGVRMTRAQNLLKEGTHSLPEIAHQTGYDSEAAFARAFKREFDISPGSYRRAIHGDEGRIAPD
ncbi:AraC-type DNA-binding protein [Sphingobium faniae]|nr:AraC-type DNA-binding protein [Sphingobium faniae]